MFEDKVSEARRNERELECWIDELVGIVYEMPSIGTRSDGRLFALDAPKLRKRRAVAQQLASWDRNE